MSDDPGEGTEPAADADRPEGDAGPPESADDRGPSGAPGSLDAGPTGVRRLSPLSIPYRVARRGVGTLLTLFFVGVTGASAVGGPLGLAVVVAVLGVASVALVGYEVARYRRYEYELTADSLDIRSGVFARRDREIPFRRVQNVDVTRSAVHRILGIAAVNVETAGGSETEGALRYVEEGEARRLQDEVASRKRLLAGEASGDAADESTDETLFELSTGELVLVGLLSFDLRVPGALLLLASGSLPSLVPSTGGANALVVVGLVGLLVALLVVSWAASAAAAVVNYYGFRLTRVGDDLRYERGLFRRYDGAIPLEKVQTLTVEDNPLKRRAGYATLRVETAGYASGADRGDGAQSATAVPLAARSRLLSLAREIHAFGDPDFVRPPRRVRRRYAVRYGLAFLAATALLFVADALVRSFPVPWYAPLAVVPLAGVLAHYVWAHRGYWLGPDHVVTRNGFFRRQTKVVPYDRVQTVIDARTAFQRRWSVATVTVDTAGSLSIMGQDAAAVDIDERAADDLREELVRRLRIALAD